MLPHILQVRRPVVVVTRMRDRTPTNLSTYGYTTTIRMSKEGQERLERAMALTGVSQGSFMRQCIANMSDAIIAAAELEGEDAEAAMRATAIASGKK